MAKEIGVSQRAIEYWEREKRVPRIESIKAIADYFNISLDSFF
ncbi:helix-turn-helix transcriptional regulator [Anaerofustis butyriciformans]